jgi:hypothetical protein
MPSLREREKKRERKREKTSYLVQSPVMASGIQQVCNEKTECP